MQKYAKTLADEMKSKLNIEGFQKELMEMEERSNFQANVGLTSLDDV